MIAAEEAMLAVATVREEARLAPLRARHALDRAIQESGYSEAGRLRLLAAYPDEYARLYAA